MTSGHAEFDGNTHTLKLWLVEGNAKTLRHTIAARGDAVGDPGYPDRFGVDCRAPAGEYFVGAAEICAVRQPDGAVKVMHDDDAGYGCWFSPLLDPLGIQASHGRAGIGVHGGGTVLPDPFAERQALVPTLGCIRIGNADNEQIFVPFVRDVRLRNPHPDTAVRFTIVW